MKLIGLGSEIDIVFAPFGIADDFDARSLGAGADQFGATDAVRNVGIGDRDFFGAGLLGVAQHRIGQHGVGRDRHENVLGVLPQIILRHDTDFEHLVLLVDRRDHFAGRRNGWTESSADLVLKDEPVGELDRFRLVAAVVIDRHGDVLAGDAAGLIPLLHGQQCGVALRNADRAEHAFD